MSCVCRLPKVLDDPVEIGQELGGNTENCHPFNSTTGGVEPPGGTTGKASTVMFATAVRCSPVSSTADTVTAYSPSFIVREAASKMSFPPMLGPTANPLACIPLIVTVLVRSEEHTSEL